MNEDKVLITAKITELIAQKSRIEQSLNEWVATAPKLPGWILSDQKHAEDCARWYYASKIANLWEMKIRSPIVGGVSVLGDPTQTQTLFLEQAKSEDKTTSGIGGLLLFLIGYFVGWIGHVAKFESITAIGGLGILFSFVMLAEAMGLFDFTTYTAHDSRFQHFLSLLAGNPEAIGNYEFENHMQTWRKGQRLRTAMSKCTADIGRLEIILSRQAESSKESEDALAVTTAVAELYGLRPDDLNSVRY